MAYKHQTDCYRTIGGLRWPNFCDMLGRQQEEDVAEMKRKGARFRFYKHPDGYRQAFIHPDDLQRIGPTLGHA